MPFWWEMTSRHLMLRQSECNLAESDATSPLSMDSNIYHDSHHGCYLAVEIVSNILKKAQGRKFEKE